MNVIWKRPDGYLGALPEDFRVLEIAGHSRLWVHKKDQDSFPFRVSGGWQDEEASKRLNNLVSRLGQPEKSWVDYLVQSYHHSMSEDAKKYLVELRAWITDLRKVLKGDTWEMEIMDNALLAVANQVEKVEPSFLKTAEK